MRVIQVALLVAISALMSCQAYFIPTGAMQDTLHIGDHVFIRLCSECNLQRDDIVIFRPPHSPEKDYIKRCIAIPGDTFKIENSRVYINGRELREPYAKGITQYCYFSARCDQEREGIKGVVPPP